MGLLTISGNSLATVLGSCARAGFALYNELATLSCGAGRLLRDRRGAASLMFAAGAVVFIGLAGLATEGGTWYLERRHGQNTADAAATAGVLALAAGTDATAAGTAVATLNSYTSGTSNGVATTVTITPGTYNGGSFSAGGNAQNAVRALITRSPPRLFSGLFLASNPNISEAALAVIGPGINANVCALALGGGMSFGGNAQVNANNCALGSNATGTSSINFNGAGTSKSPVVGGTLTSVGSCTSGGSTYPCSGPGNLMYQPATTDPFKALQTDPNAIPASVSTCGSATATSPATLASGVYCVGQSLSLTNGNTVNLSPGIYFFYNASIKMTGGSLACTGCTIVFTGSSASKLGTLALNGGTVNLSAPVTSPYQTYNGDANYNGMLFYMDARYAEHTTSCGSAPVSIQGNNTTTLNGGMYFPNASVCVTGTMSGNSTCTELVGWSLSFTGTSGVDVSGCSTTGTNVAQTQTVQLLE